MLDDRSERDTTFVVITVTALSTNGNAIVTGGITELPQAVTYQTPPAPTPITPTAPAAAVSFAKTIITIAIIDIVF